MTDLTKSGFSVKVRGEMGGTPSSAGGPSIVLGGGGSALQSFQPTREESVRTCETRFRVLQHPDRGRRKFQTRRRGRQVRDGEGVRSLR